MSNTGKSWFGSLPVLLSIIIAILSCCLAFSLFLLAPANRYSKDLRMLLIELLENPNPGVRRIAIIEISEFDDREAFEALLETALKDRDRWIRGLATGSLRKYPRDWTASVLVRRYPRENSTEMKMRILSCLWQIEADEELKRFVQAMDIETKLALVSHDMELIAYALENTYIDYSGYLVPDEVFVPGSVYSQRYKMDPEVLKLWSQIPESKRPNVFYHRNKPPLTPGEEEIRRQIERLITEQGKHRDEYDDLEMHRSYQLRMLTTPIAYLNRPPRDIFNNHFTGGHYRYGTWSHTLREERGYLEGWILVGNGPDGDEDIDPAYVIMNATREPVVYDSYPFAGRAQSFLNLVYDPSNGMVSDGDIVRFGP